MPEDTRHRLLRYLNDAHAMEVGGLVTMQDAADRMAHPEARSLFIELSGIARTQLDRLAARIEALGGSVAANKGLFNSMMAKGNRLTNAFHDQADKDTQEVAKAVAMSWLEVGAYASLSAYSRAIGDEQTATLGDTLAAEERLAADRLNSLIPRLAVIPATQPNLYADRDREFSRSGGNTGSGGGVMAKGALPALALGGAAVVTWAIMRSRSDNGGTHYNSGSSNWQRSSATRYGTTGTDYNRGAGYNRGVDYDRQPASWSGDAATTGTTATSGHPTISSASTSSTFDTTPSAAQPDITAGAGTDAQTGETG